MGDFMECDDCQSKTGSPVLCGGCLVNRGLISQLKTENEELREENKALRENWENLREWMKGKKINFSGDDRFWRGYEDFYYDVKAKLKELEGGEVRPEDYTMLRPAKPEEIPKPEKPDFIADWLDANVWDGENVSISEFYNSLHKAHFSPRSLYELFTECFEFAIEKTKELEK